jgi:hypothetical protein
MIHPKYGGQRQLIIFHKKDYRIFNWEDSTGYEQRWIDKLVFEDWNKKRFGNWLWEMSEEKELKMSFGFLTGTKKMQKGWDSAVCGFGHVKCYIP